MHLSIYTNVYVKYSSLHVTLNACCTFVSNECLKCFYTESELKHHAVKHSNAKLFCCGLCAKDFKYKQYVPKHFKRCAVRLGYSDVQSIYESVG